MFFDKQSKKQQNYYEKNLKVIWSLSNIFSESKIPYLHYRIAEKIFCKSFLAEDLWRSDVSVDARKGKLWIWLKTFLIWNKKTLQKVAEFNKDKNLYEWLWDRDKVLRIAQLRNERIDFTERNYGLDKSIYHCVVRDKNRFLIHEESLNKIDIWNIAGIKNSKSSITFHDSYREYSFNISKSTLFKRFVTTNVLNEFDVNIIKDPLSELQNIFWRDDIEFWPDSEIQQTIFLPLYGKWKKVYERSWLNQWNANGRRRKDNEIYIPIPAEIHKRFPKFFPSRDEPFKLKLPNDETLDVKLCQEWSKALMSNPNKDLWKWLLRDILKIDEWKILTYERLQILWIDSVRIDKLNKNEFKINFSGTWSYENFLSLTN